MELASKGRGFWWRCLHLDLCPGFHLVRWLWSTEVVGVGKPSLFLFGRMLKWSLSERDDFPILCHLCPSLDTEKSQLWRWSVPERILVTNSPHWHCSGHAAAVDVTLMLGTGGCRKWGDAPWRRQNMALSGPVQFLSRLQHSASVAQSWHMARSGRSWIHSCCDLGRGILRLLVWHLKQGSWNYYFCLLPVYHFGTIMWTESSVKKSYDNLYLLDLGPFPSSTEGQFIATAFFLSH